MLVIVEGVDGVGKTTFVEQLATLLEQTEPEIRVVKLKAGPPRPGGEILEEYELPLQDYVPGEGRHVICDRWHVGELIYGPMLRGTSQLDRARLIHLEMFLRSKGAYIAHLTAPTHEIVARRQKRGGLDLLEDDEVDLVVHRYLDVLWDSNVKLHVNYWGAGGHQDEKILRDTMFSAHERDVRARHLTQFNTYVGPPDPMFLLLGEKRNQNHDDRWDSAFAPTPTGNSGHFLLDGLPAEFRSKAGMANALEEDLNDLFRVLAFPKVVTLGKAADEICTGYPHGSVPHPQYVRRFHHKHQFDYGHMIRRAAMFGEDLLSWRP